MIKQNYVNSEILARMYQFRYSFIPFCLVTDPLSFVYWTSCFCELSKIAVNIGVAKPRHTWTAAWASPIFAPTSASYLDF